MVFTEHSGFRPIAALCTAGLVSAVLLAGLARLSAPQRSLASLPEQSGMELLIAQLPAFGEDKLSSAQELPIRLAACSLHRHEGRYTEAARECEAARDLASPHVDEKWAETLHELGLVRLQQGRLREAHAILESAVRAAAPQGDLAVATRYAFANVQREMGHLDIALDLYWAAWKTSKARGRQDSERLPALIADLAETYARKGELGTAEGYLQQAVKQQQLIVRELHRSLAPEEPALAAMLQVRASLQHLSGDIPQAVSLYHKAGRMLAAGLRPDHPDLVANRLGLARAQRDLGDSESALRILVELEQTLRSGPNEGLDLSRLLILKADLLRQAKDHSGAHSVIEEASRLQSDTLQDEDSFEVATALHIYGSILHDGGNLTEAHQKYSSALEVHLRTVGQDHPDTAANHNSLGTLHEDVGDAASASKHYQRCLEIQLQTLGEKSQDVANTYNNLATLLFKAGRLEDAVRYLTRAVAVLDALGVSAGNPERTLYEDNLAAVLRQSGKAAPSEESIAALRTASVHEMHSEQMLGEDRDLLREYEPDAGSEEADVDRRRQEFFDQDEDDDVFAFSGHDAL